MYLQILKMTILKLKALLISDSEQWGFTICGFMTNELQHGE